MNDKLTLKEVLTNIYKYWPAKDNENSDWDKCFEYCLMGARMGDGSSMANTALCYEHGYGVKQNGKLALYWAQEGAKVGNKVAICHLARYFENGEFVKIDFKKAQEYYKLAGDKGYGRGYGNLGCMYAEGIGCERNYDKAVEFWLKAFNMGEKWVAKYLCECYFYEWGVKKDIEKVRYYLQFAYDDPEYDWGIDYELENYESEKPIVVSQISNDEKKIKKDNNGGVKERLKYDTDFVLNGHNDLTKYFNEEIIDFFKNMDAYEEMGIHSVPATLLYGPPGCGKTYVVNEVAKYLRLPVFEINSLTVASSYVHGTSKKIAEVFAKARENAPSILIIDEFETYVGTRDEKDWKSTVEETDEFLRNIGPAIDDKVIIFAMTNIPKVIDPAILRKGRFDNQVEVGPASEEEIIGVLKEEFAKTKADENLTFAEIAKKLNGRPLSDIGYLVKQAIRVAVRNERRIVRQEDIDVVLQKMLNENEPKYVTIHRPMGFQTEHINDKSNETDKKREKKADKKVKKISDL